MLSDYIAVKPSTQYSYQGISAFSERLGFYDKDKNLISVHNVSTLLQYQTLTTPSNCYYFRTTVLKVDVDAYQFEESSTSTNYVEHKEQTFTFPLGNEKSMLGDYLADDGIHHVRGQVTFDGTENWQNYVTVSENIVQAMLSITGFNSRTALCDSFKVTADYSATEHLVIGSTLLSLYVHLDKTRLNTEDITGFKNWLSTHNIVLEYELAEETITPYTSAQQEVYNQIKQALSYEEQTNISGTSDGSNPIFNVEGYQNTKLILQDISNAIVALGGV